MAEGWPSDSRAARTANEQRREYRRRTEFDPSALAPQTSLPSVGAPAQTAISRRAFWREAAGGLLLTISLPLAAQTPAPDERAALSEVSARFLFEESGAITGFTGKVELGQGSRTLLSQAIAEEFSVPVSRVSLVMGDTARVPDDGGTWASLTSPLTVPTVRATAAAARSIFVAAAAEAWATRAESLHIEDGFVTGASGRRMPLFEAAQLARSSPSSLPIARTPVPPAEWKALGQSVSPVRGREIVTGAPIYSSDFRMPGMLYGAMVRGPHYRAKILRVRGEDRLPPGVQVIHEGDFLGVVAPDISSARLAAKSLTVIWDPESLPPAEKLNAYFKQTAREPVFQKGARYPGLLTKGDANTAYFASPLRYESAYTTDYIAHVPLETSVATAAWEGDRLTVHYGCQAPFLTMESLARTFEIPEANVRVVSYDTGGAFGGKQGSTVAVEAARLARAAGKPVQLHYTREDEFQANYFRPAALIGIRSAADAKGQIQSFEFHNYNSGASGLAVPYSFPNYYLGYHPADSPFRQGSYRALAAVANTFARELHMEEWASNLKEDAVAFRLRHITDARLKEAMQRGAERFGWGKAAPRLGVAQGMACTIEKEARLAFFVELKAGGKDVQLLRALTVFDPGAVLNPDNLRNQIVGNVMQATGPALYERILWDETRLRTRRISEYRVPRFSDVLEIGVELIDRREVPPAGAGESPNTVVAPAIAAAIRRATGIWVRHLPLLPALAAAVSGTTEPPQPRGPKA